MRHTETLPNWAQRLTARSAQRRTKNRITRWMKLPTAKPCVGSGKSTMDAHAFEPSSNDNLVPFPIRAAI